MRTYCIAQTALLMHCGDLNQKKHHKGRDVCVCAANSVCCTVETNTTL